MLLAAAPEAAAVARRTDGGLAVHIVADAETSAAHAVGGVDSRRRQSIDGVVAALSLVHANNQIQRLRSAIVDRYDAISMCEGVIS